MISVIIFAISPTKKEDILVNSVSISSDGRKLIVHINVLWMFSKISVYYVIAKEIPSSIPFCLPI